MKIRNTKRQQGFTVIEALVALLVVSLGMLGIVGFQLTLSLNSDVAKQRTEATRLAQEKIEQLRAFKDLTSYGSSLASGSDSFTATVAGSNTDFARTWNVSTISGASTPETGRNILVTVTWTDRANNTQTVQLLSAISATDPSTNGSLFFPLPEGTILHRPKNRNMDIPIPATSITGTDNSYIPWTGTSGGYIVFSNTSGDIVKTCTQTPTLANLSTCTTFNGYLLSGYITTVPEKIKGQDVAYNVTNISFSQTQYIPTSDPPQCSIAPAIDQTTLGQQTPATIPNTLYYVCLIAPTDSTATPPVWTGRTDLTVSATPSGTTTYTCRYSTDANTTNNDNHPAVYNSVDHSLDNQNFYLDTNACASTSASRVAHKTNS